MTKTNNGLNLEHNTS